MLLAVKTNSVPANVSVPYNITLQRTCILPQATRFPAKLACFAASNLCWVGNTDETVQHHNLIGCFINFWWNFVG